MTESTPLNAADLRLMGIDHELIRTDVELVEMVQMLLELGVELDDMVGTDLTFVGAPLLIRPDATIEPGEVFTRAQSDAEFRERAAVALGYNIDEDTRLLTPAEVETVEFFSLLRDMVGEDDVLAMMRVMGSSMGRLSRTVISLLRVHFEKPLIDDDGSLVEVGRVYRRITEDMLPQFLDAAASVLRRHLAVAAAAPTTWNVDGSRAATMERLTVGFVDLVGFTSFTEQANLTEFIDALTVFESAAQSVIVTNGGTLVKLIGDEVMFVAPTPASGVEIARRLANLPLDEGGPGSVRIGLAAGDVVAVGGDYYGTVVNIASRSVGHADPDTIVATTQVVNGAHASARFESIGARELRGISEPVELFRLL